MTPAHENPFRVQRTDALPFEPQGATWDDLMQRLHRLRFRGAIVGPHGSGKTTMLLALAPRLESLGLTPRILFRNRGGGGAMPPEWRDTLASIRESDVLLVDGYTHLGALGRWRVRTTARRAAGLVVTAHGRCGLPPLHHTSTTPDLLAQLVERLHAAVPREHIDAVFHEHRGNLRDCLRALYDRQALA